MSRRVGIEKLRIYPSTMSLDMQTLCAARGHDPADIRDTMMIDQRSVNPPWEDPVTMAVNAALPMLTEEDRASIELLIVGSESGVDQEKPMSTWVHRYLGLKPRCRNFELKHACYSGTAGLQLAAGWVASGLSPGAKALIVTTDQGRMHLGKPYEYVMGAGAAAVLVSDRPRVLELELGKNGICTQEVSDLTRPTSRVETGNSETSLLSYLDALEGAYTDYLEHAGEPVDFDTYFKKNLYHIPFCGLTYRAHRTLLRIFSEVPRSEAWTHFEKKSLAGATYARRMNGTYSSSTMVALTGLIANSPDLEPGDRIGIFSYGSGSCAEYYSGLVCPEAKDVVRAAKLPELLDARYPLSVREYEEAERERTCYIDCGDFTSSIDGFNGWYEKHYQGRGYLVFQGVEEHYRKYAWS